MMDISKKRNCNQTWFYLLKPVVENSFPAKSAVHFCIKNTLAWLSGWCKPDYVFNFIVLPDVSSVLHRLYRGFIKRNVLNLHKQFQDNDFILMSMAC